MLSAKVTKDFLLDGHLSVVGFVAFVARSLLPIGLVEEGRDEGLKPIEVETYVVSLVAFVVPSWRHTVLRRIYVRRMFYRIL